MRLRLLKREFIAITETHITDVGICAVLEQSTPGFYYFDHLEIHKDFRRRGLAEKLIKFMKNQLTDYIEIEISLDTHVFNRPAQALYDKCGFEKLSIHPIATKQNTYFHYVLKRQP